MATPDQYDEMHQRLREHGVFPASWSAGDAPTWEAETGHHFNVRHVPSYGWGLSIIHMGDPVGAGLHVSLGHDDELAARRVAAEMRHPDTLGHMRDQYNRARLNNDPTGHDAQARRVPFATGDWVHLNHYGD